MTDTPIPAPDLLARLRQRASFLEHLPHLSVDGYGDDLVMNSSSAVAIAALLNEAAAALAAAEQGRQELREELAEDPQLVAFRAAYGYDWPTCHITDCGYKVCTWASEFYCAPHSLELLGPDAMTQRYNDTHPYTPWTEPYPPGGKPEEDVDA